MEASIFRKPYFVGRFLPALLKPRPLPDVPDLRMKFIQALCRAGKIPSGIYSAYEKACKKEANSLLEGVFSDEEDMDDLLLSPMEQLDASLQHFAQIVFTSHQTPKQQAGIPGQISLISGKIHGVLETEHGGSTQNGPIVIDVNSHSFSKAHFRVTDAVLSMVCQLVCGLSQNFPSQNPGWLTQLLAMLTQHSGIIEALLYTVRRQLATQNDNLEFHHVQGLAAILIHLISLPDVFGEISIKSGAEKVLPLQEDVTFLLKCSCKKEMDHVLRYDARFPSTSSTF